MQFKHPEILYALFLLLIPIFIHLFQLRRFQKIEFTNVQLLRKVTLQTRKSSVIKKWLTLLMRLLALACLVFAFAQPFQPKTEADLEKEIVVYVDNSFSLQAEGSKGSLLEGSLQELYQGFPTANLSWFTNNSEFKNVSSEDFKNEILGVSFSSSSLNPTEVLLKADQFYSKRPDVQKQLIYISDFQNIADFPEIPTDLEVRAVPLKPAKISNISIDTLFIKSKNASKTELMITVSKQGNTPSEVPISLFNKEELIAKTAVDLTDKTEENILFDIDATDGFIGRAELTDAHINFDNSLYFSINKQNKINVLAVNETSGKFLKKLFHDENFNLLQFESDRLEYHHLPEQNLIVLNQLKEIPNALITALKSFLDTDGSLLIIPPKNADISSYNSLLAAANLGQISQQNDADKKITNIVFSHPIFSEVFEKEVTNFQYPKVNSFYEITTAATPVLNFEDHRPFLLQSKSTYFFTAALDVENSNFLNSPLVVPTIYNMGLQSLPLPDIYFTIGKQNRFAVPVPLGPDEILSLQSEDESFIPLQQRKSNYVEITTSDLPETAGNYEVMRKDDRVQFVGFNYSREEGKLVYANPEHWKNAHIHKNIPELISELSNADSVQGFWKWFVIFAFVFLIFEMLILKFLK